MMKETPQDILATHMPFIETGAWKASYLHQTRELDIHPWKALSDLPETHDLHPGVKVCPIERAKLLQALIDSGQVKNRSELATRLGISRARITQILRRLKAPSR